MKVRPSLHANTTVRCFCVCVDSPAMPDALSQSLGALSLAPEVRMRRVHTDSSEDVMKPCQDHSFFSYRLAAVDRRHPYRRHFLVSVFTACDSVTTEELPPQDWTGRHGCYSAREEWLGSCYLLQSRDDDEHRWIRWADLSLDSHRWESVTAADQADVRVAMEAALVRADEWHGQ